MALMLADTHKHLFLMSSVYLAIHGELRGVQSKQTAEFF